MPSATSGREATSSAAGPIPDPILVFLLEEQRYGLSLAITERVLAAVETTPLPNAPAIVLGIFNLQGRIIPVLDVRRRFGLSPRTLSPDQQFVVARTATHTVALAVDATSGVLDVPADAEVAAETVLRDVPYVRGVLRMPDGLVLIHDLDTFLADAEIAALEAALRTSERGACER